MPSGSVCILTKDTDSLTILDVKVIFKRGISGTQAGYGREICKVKTLFFSWKTFFFNIQKLREMDLNFFIAPKGTNTVLICIMQYWENTFPPDVPLF